MEINKNMTTTIEVPVGTSVLNITQESDRILFEFVPKFKEGVFLYSDAYDQETILIFKKIYNNCLYYYVCMENGDYLDLRELNYWTNIEDFRLATEAEQQQLLYVMKKKGKQWDAEKLCIEDIPQRKFKPGDKVRLKDGMLDKRWEFAEDWLELYFSKPEVGELAIFWDSCKGLSRIRIYAQRTAESHRDHLGMLWVNAIKFISKEQFEQHIKE